MTDQFTPSTEQVRSHYVFDQSNHWTPERGDAFDRWLREHDAALIESLAERADSDWREGSWTLVRGTGNWLRNRAQQIREGKHHEEDHHHRGCPGHAHPDRRTIRRR